MRKNESITGQRPCFTCRQPVCTELHCPRWKAWFLESWAAVNHYGWAVRDELGREEPRVFVYDQPHMIKSPCCGCPCAGWCDTPCSLRIKWWDARIGALKRKLGGDGR